MNERWMAHLFRAMLTSTLGAVVVGVSRWLYPTEKKDWVEVNQVRLELPRLGPAFHGYRLVQISDFHIGTWMNRDRLVEAVDLVNRQEPDLVAITGDFVTIHPERYAPDLVYALSRLRAQDGVVAVLGNHDQWTDPVLVRNVLRESGIHDLSNCAISLSRGAEQLHIAGVDDYYDHHSRLDLVLDNLPPQGASILLAHEPDFADESAASGRFDLQISGHSHGGQVHLPVLGIPFLPKYSHKYPCGLYQVGDMYQYTNRGLGTAEFQVRLNCPAEITVFILECGIQS